MLSGMSELYLKRAVYHNPNIKDRHKIMMGLNYGYPEDLIEDMIFEGMRQVEV